MMLLNCNITSKRFSCCMKELSKSRCLTVLQFNCSKCYCTCANHVIRHEDVCPLQHEGEFGSFPVVIKSVESIVRSEQLSVICWKLCKDCFVLATCQQ